MKECSKFPLPTVFKTETYTTICSSFKSIETLFLELSCTETDRQTDKHEYSIVGIDKPQLQLCIIQIPVWKYCCSTSRILVHYI